MLNGQSPLWLHLAQNLALISLSLFFLPLDTLVLVYSYALQVLAPQHATRRRIQRSPGFRPKTVLVTGVGMSKGLALARMFYLAGHNVIGADTERHRVPVNGRFSKALRKFYALPLPSEQNGAADYIQCLLNIVRREKVDLWVSCSGVSTAVEDGQAKEVIERRSDCKAVQFDVPTTEMLHEKHSFIQRTVALGLPAPETYDVTTRTAVHKVLNNSPTKKYIMKTIGVDDSKRSSMPILPRRTLSETYSTVSRLPISPMKPWVLQEYIQGEEYCTHALIVKGHVKAFVACPSLELLMHYEALPATSALSKAMLRFTKEFVARSGQEMTGHLSFDFMVEETATEKGMQKSLYPIECNPRTHTAVVLFHSLGPAMSKQYMEALVQEPNGVINGSAISGEEEIVLTPQNPPRFYWIGHDFVTLVLYPAIQVARRKLGLHAFLSGCVEFLQHLFFWKDGTYEIWDPLPWWWLYHIYWPGQFLACILWRKNWSRINVSTTKMFAC